MSRPANAALHWTTSERAKAPILRIASSTSGVDGGVVAGQGDQLGDVHALIAHPLDVLDRVQQGRDQPQVASDRRLEREQRQDPLVDFQVAAVDAVVVGDHHLRQLDVPVLERLEHPVELLDDQVEAAEGVRLELLQLVLEVERGPVPAAAAAASVGDRADDGSCLRSAELAGDIFLGPGVAGLGEDLLRRADLDQLAGEHERRAVGDARRPAACCG